MSPGYKEVLHFNLIPAINSSLLLSTPSSLSNSPITNMKFTFASLALPLLAAAAPAPAPAPAPAANPPFSVMAARSGSPIHYMQMNAAGQKFYLGGKTSSYCPSPTVEHCPPGNQTVFSPGGNSLVRSTAARSYAQGEKKKRKKQ